VAGKVTVGLALHWPCINNFSDVISYRLKAHKRDCKKTAEVIKIPFELWTQLGPRNHVLDGVQIPPWEGAILRGGKDRPIVKCGVNVAFLSNYFDHLFLITACSELCKVLFLVLFVTLFVNQISRELLNGFALNSQG